MFTPNHIATIALTRYSSDADGGHVVINGTQQPYKVNDWNSIRIKFGSEHSVEVLKSGIRYSVIIPIYSKITGKMEQADIAPSYTFVGDVNTS